MAAMAAAVAAAAKEEQREKDATENATLNKILKVAGSCFRRCVAFVASGSPPEPCKEVQELLRHLKMQPGHLLKLYDTFHHLWQEEKAQVSTRTTQISPACVLSLITERRQWVEHLLTRLLLLGDAEDTLSWDKFLWIFLRFCSLSKVELGQTLFVMIAKEVESPTLHYLTSEALKTYFSNYKNCPVKSFNTESMEFDKLPLTRYYPSDFCEVVMRFPRLLNPLVHLQLSLQKYLPSSAFWDNFDQSSFCRKVSFEFFTINKHRVFIRGEPPFRETCDMLAPDALGPEPVNKDQWLARTSGQNSGSGLRHVSVWGEQLLPEILDLLPHSSQGPEAMEAAVNMVNAKVYNYKAPLPEQLGKPLPVAFTAHQHQPAVSFAPTAEITTPSTQTPALGQPPVAALPAPSGPPDRNRPVKPRQSLPGPPVPAHPVLAWDGRPDQPPQRADMSKMRASAAAPKVDPATLAVAAAVLDEEDAWPTDAPPPGWMRNCTVAPAPVRRGPDPPLPVVRAPKPQSRQSASRQTQVVIDNQSVL